jgi:MFS family permease
LDEGSQQLLLARRKTFNLTGMHEQTANPSQGTLPPEAGDVPERVDRRFIGTFTIAHIGAAFAFAPLLNILVPLRAEQIDPAQKQLLLSNLLFWGAVTAGLSNVVFGALSDGTRSRFGRRRPWIFAGLVGSLVSYLIIAQATARGPLLLGLIVFQLWFNALYAALAAVFPDRVPDQQKGVASGWIGIGYPVGAGLGALAVGRLLSGTTARYSLIALILVATVTPFLLLLRERPLSNGSMPSPPPSPRYKPARLLAYRDFTYAWAARFMVQTGFFIAAAYGLYYLEDVVDYSRAVAGGRPEQGLATLIFAATAANILASIAAGRLSDRTGRRKLFIVGGAGMVGLAMLLASLGLSWPVPIAIWLLLGAGMGVFIAVESALVAQVLPSPGHAGRDLGLMNLGNTLPQCVAPGLAYLLLHGAHPDYRIFFAVGGVIALLGAAAIQPIRSVR